MSNKKTYWKGLPELKNDPVAVKNASNEFGNAPEADDNGHSRRDFLKLMGFSVAAVSLAACETPIRKAIPYVNKPMDVDPGIPNYYASSYVSGGDYCSIVVKTREGRPIKIEGNALSKVTHGGTSAQVEASVLSLYDSTRLRSPMVGTEKKDKVKWETVDSQIIEKLAGSSNIRIVSNTILSPSTKAAIDVFKAKYSSTQHIQYDPASSYGIWKANSQSFGAGFIPSYDFSKAMTIVSVAADFLGTWLTPIIFSKQYAVNRTVSEEKPEMSRHYQFESILSLTGANSDYRTMIKPSQEGLVVAQLYNLIAAKAGQSGLSASIDKVEHLEEAANELWENRGKALVIAGSNDSDVQVIVNAINNMLGSYGSTIISSKPVNFRQGNDELMDAFISDVEGGKVDAVIFYNCNPVYDHPRGAKLGAAIKNLGLSVSTAVTEDETASLCGHIAPDHHYLESWNDFEPVRNSFSLSQPAISKIFSTRQVQESFMIWAGVPVADAEYYTFLKNNWTKAFYASAGAGMNEQAFWDKSLYDGVLDVAGDAAAPAFTGDTAGAGSRIGSNYNASSTGLEVVVYESCSVGTGAQANNPLLQELPDPITKAVWDHYVTISLKDATALSIENDAEGHTQLVNISANGSQPLKVAALVQPGQTPGTIGIALGYGRTKVGKVGMGETGNGIGVNAFVLVSSLNGSLNYSATTGVKLEKTDEDFQLAQTQIHHTSMNRENVIQETTLAEFKENPYAGRWEPHVTKWDEELAAKSLSMWKGHHYNNHHWGMAIDMNSCTGCGSCVVACNVENNVAIVGKDEVIRRREMHWLRIDRYYSATPGTDDYKKLEIAAENPEVTFQPMLCQHCNNAPCETVCPVAATTHSTEGLNQMTYNRCIGTRYCANNCPYKVRRFNWFKYHDNQKFLQSNPQMNTDLGRMVLNPDVTVRSRGVMEKCSFCAQRIQYGKLTAKRERRVLKDGEVEVACAAACTSGAIVFGDMNNPETRISKLLKISVDEKGASPSDKNTSNPRAYRVLEDIGVKPNIFYLNKIRNKRPANA
ncbi:MAG TPA: TAT-variant-translocated molybdopterin oxidoreductase [Cyclobacteriaceae bacterium]|nr:TAT-variant-translocated molybdopterin oxidoreductase [Cyclobacteriaceae bacterium]